MKAKTLASLFLVTEHAESSEGAQPFESRCLAYAGARAGHAMLVTKLQPELTRIYNPEPQYNLTNRSKRPQKSKTSARKYRSLELQHG